jgi:hypothetical protein
VKRIAAMEGELPPEALSATVMSVAQHLLARKIHCLQTNGTLLANGRRHVAFSRLSIIRTGGRVRWVAGRALTHCHAGATVSHHRTGSSARMASKVRCCYATDRRVDAPLANSRVGILESA